MGRVARTTLMTLGLSLFMGTGGCTGDEGRSPIDADGVDIGGEVLIGGGLDTTGELDAGSTPEEAGPVGDITEPDPQCALSCEPWSGCDAHINTACVTACEAGDAGACETGCLESAQTCEEAAECAEDQSIVRAFETGDYGWGARDLAGPFTLPTLGGTFDFEASWTGQDSYLFLITQNEWEYGQALWESSIFSWLTDAPKNTHIFFMAYNDADGTDNATEHVTAMRDRVEGALEKIGLAWGQGPVCHWRRRIHYVTQSPWAEDDWIGAKLQANGVAAFGIDRFQRVRNVGMLYVLSSNNPTPQLYHLKYTAEHFDFEWDREQARWTDEVTTVEVITNQSTGGGAFEVELPDPEVMAAFDSMEIDLKSYCPNHEEGEGCPEWDYKANLRVAEHPLEEMNPDEETPCQPLVQAVEASDDVVGSCSDLEDVSCVTDADCGEDGTCDGYVAAVESVDGVEAEVLACSCAVPGSDPRESTKTCRADGSGFDGCSCNQEWEFARWITSYGREGRWVSDVSPFLAWFRNGGKVRLKYSAGNTYVTWMNLRFYTQGKDGSSQEIVQLFGGGGYNDSYNNKYEPLTVEIPEGTKSVELVAYITGHGFGTELENCAEFCDHTHHFTINGTTFSHDHPMSGQMYGCAAQVSDGCIPNQYGTWYLGRGGWCPGMDVKPFRVDVTSAVDPGAAATLTYESLFEGAPYVPQPNPNPQGGFGSSIWMTSWLVLHQ
jgi:hypothetical protein